MATIPTHEELEHLAKRLDAAPEFAVTKLDALEAASAEVAALRRQVEELQAGKRSGIVTSWGYTSETPRRMIATVSANDRAPSVDVVTVPREYLEMLQSAANRFCSSCRDNNETCTMTSRHFGGTGCGAWKLDGTRINALRSAQAPAQRGEG